jgi:flagellin
LKTSRFIKNIPPNFDYFDTISASAEVFMALSDLQKLFVVSTATQIWQQDLLTNAYFQGSAVGANLREMILGQQPVKPLTNPFDEAITGRLRSDSAAIRRAGKNVLEASSMVGIAASAVGTIKGVLEEMQSLAQQIKDGTLAYSVDVENQYNALRDSITPIIEGTYHNGIAVLDKSQWDTDQISADGKVHIQSLPSAVGGGGFDVVFQEMDEAGLAALDGGNLEDNPAGSLQTELDNLSTHIGDMATLEEIYSQREDGLTYQATALDSQADLLDQAVEARRQTPTLSLEEILIRLLMRDTGTLLDELS